MLDDYDPERDPDYIRCPECQSLETAQFAVDMDVVGYTAIREDVVADIYWRRCKSCGHEFGVADTRGWRNFTWDYADKRVR